MNILFLSCLFLITSLLICNAQDLKRIPCSSPEEKAAVWQIVKGHLEESDVPEPLRKSISLSTIKGYEKNFPHRLVVFRNNSHIVSLKQRLENGKKVYSLGYANRGSAKMKAKLLTEAIEDHKSQVKEPDFESELRSIFALYHLDEETTSKYSLYEIPVKYINRLKADKMWSREEVIGTFPNKFKSLFDANSLKISYLIYAGENHVVGLTNKHPYFSIYPLKVKTETILSPRTIRKADPRDDNYLIIPDFMKASLESEGTLQIAQIIAKELNYRLANEFCVFTVDYRNINEIDTAHGKVYDRSLVLYGEIPVIEKNLSPIEISVRRKIGYYFNSLLDLPKAGLKAEIFYPAGIQISNNKGQILKNSTGGDFFNFYYKTGNLWLSSVWHSHSVVRGQLSSAYEMFKRNDSIFGIESLIAEANDNGTEQETLISLCRKWSAVYNSHVYVSRIILNSIAFQGERYAQPLPKQTDRRCYDLKRFADEFIKTDEAYDIIGVDEEKIRLRLEEFMYKDSSSIRKNYGE